MPNLPFLYNLLSPIKEPEYLGAACIDAITFTSG